MEIDERTKELAKKYNKLALLLPTYKILNTKSYQCMIVLLTRLFKVGFDVSVLLLDQTNVVIARNHLAKHFMEADEMVGGYDIAMWIDSDQTFEFSDFMNLLYHYDECHDKDGVRVLSGRYISRDLSTPKVCAFIREEDGKYKAIQPESRGIVEVDGFGFGFVLMEPEVIKEMYEEYGIMQFGYKFVGDKDTGGMIGEDLDWCEKAQKIGIKLFFDNEVSIGHFGGIIDDRHVGVTIRK